MGGWVGGWVVEEIEGNEAVRMRCCMYGVGWVNGWVGGRAYQGVVGEGGGWVSHGGASHAFGEGGWKGSGPACEEVRE